jgi:DsbC/DsbD-like thiol-disulfide interchange protein
MAIMLRTVTAAIFFIVSVFPAAAQPPSSQGFHSHVRLISGGREADHWMAGVEITLDKGFKTYWRNPGESGLPPRFDWSASDNVADVEVKWPAPSRHEDAAGIAYTYSGKVILPVRVKAADPGRPVRLSLSIEYGICKDICIPAQAELSTDLSGGDPERPLIQQALAQVPQPQALGQDGALSVLSVRPVAQDKPVLSVAVRAPAGEKPTLFAEGPENWYVSTSLADDENRFTVTVEEKPKEASGPVSLRLTLVAGGKAVETEVSLDGNGVPR